MVHPAKAAELAALPRTHERDFEVSILMLPSSADRWPLVMKFLALRKAVFIDQMNWGLFHAEGVEFEQYDFIGVVYVVAHRGSEVLGGARLVRTDNRVGTGGITYSYMIRDACLGVLKNMPTALCEKAPPVAADIWELTRLVAIREQGVGEAILVASNRFLHHLAAKECLFLGSPAFMRMAKRMGFSPSPLGKAQSNVDGRFLAFSCKVINPANVRDPESVSGQEVSRRSHQEVET